MIFHPSLAKSMIKAAVVYHEDVLHGRCAAVFAIPQGHEKRQVSGEQQIRIYYTSGTGNSYRISQWLAARAEASGRLAGVVSIEEARCAEQLRADGAQTLVLVTPTHGFTTPWHMLRFAVRLPAGCFIPLYCVATRAGMRFDIWNPGDTKPNYRRS